MQRLVCALSLVACAAAHAQGGPDLMKTPECLSARQQLEEVLSGREPRDRLALVQRQAALKCLGVSLPEDGLGQPRLKTERSASARPGNRVLLPPVAAEPIRLRPTPSLSHVPAAPGPVAAPPAPPGPVVITTCDAAGCWDSTGARHHQQGPVLLGPRGICTQQGGLLNCP